MSPRSRGAVVALAGLLAVPAVLVAAPGAQAHAPHRGHRGATPLGLHASSAAMPAGTAVELSGTGRGRGHGAVTLLESSGGSWTRVARSRPAHGAYHFTLVPAAGRHAYRVTQRTGDGTVTSPTIRVSVAAPSVDPALAAARAQILADTNAYRSQAGLAPLVESDAVDAEAQDWTEQMAATGDFEHNPDFADQLPTGWTRAGENIAYGYDPDTVGAGWFASPGHRANLLGDYTVIGIGYAVDSTGRGYFTQDFAKY